MPTGNAIQTATIVSGGGSSSGTATLALQANALVDTTGTVNVSNAAAPAAAGSVLTSSDTTDAIWSTTTGTVGSAGVAAFAANSGTATIAGFSTNSGTATIAGFATNAGTATIAGFATNAGTATVSTFAGTATTAATCTGTAAYASAIATGITLPDYIAPAVVTLTMASAITVNAALGNDFRVTLTAGTGTMGSPSNSVDGQRIDFQVTQDTTGNRLLAWNAVYDWGVAGTATLSTGTSLTDIIGFIYNGSKTKWLCVGTILGF